MIVLIYVGVGMACLALLVIPWAVGAKSVTAYRLAGLGIYGSLAGLALVVGAVAWSLFTNA